MNKQKVTRIVRFNVIIIAMGMLISGCDVTWRAYSDASLPQNKIAILRCKTGFKYRDFGLYITQIDGKILLPNTNVNEYTRIKLLPGKHQIKFEPFYPSSRGFTTDVYVEAGEKYVAKLLTENMHYISRQNIGGIEPRRINSIGAWKFIK